MPKPDSTQVRVCTYRGRLLGALLASIAITACTAPIASGDGRVSGTVGAWPARPLGGDIAPAPNKVVEFVRLSASPIFTATSDARGKYSINLRPGTYEVRLAGFAPTGLLYGRDPDTYGQWPRVTVAVGRESKLDLIYDSGIR
jgi:hypothetical protein